MVDLNSAAGDRPAHDQDRVDREAIARAEAGWWTDSMKTLDARLAWWREARFGCFVHWGVYSRLGGEWRGEPYRGYAEHIQRMARIDQATYRAEVVGKFNPADFDAEEWIRAVSDAGMKYFVITAKHHDGFAMYDSAVTDYNIVAATPFGRDPMAELRDACRRHGIRFGFYYSHAFDWGEPHGAGNDWEFERPGGDRGLHGGRDWWDERPDLIPEMAEKYVDAKSIPQILELIEKYQPDILWFDTPHKLPFSENMRILQAIRGVSADVVVNGRLARTAGRNFGDYRNTGDKAAEFRSTGGDWEGIPTTNESYGYHADDHAHKSAEFFVRLIAKAASRNGNSLLNIGPRGDGRIDPKDLEILGGIGRWMRVYGESIHGTTRSPLPLQSWGVTTAGDKRLFLHVFDWPRDGRLVVGGLASEPARAWAMADPGAPLEWRRESDVDLALSIPESAPDAANSVIVLEFKNAIEDAIEAHPVRLLDPRARNRLLVFDAKAEGEGAERFGYGDGKTRCFHATNWTGTDQWFAWGFRLNEPARFDVALHYYCDAPGGRCVIEVDGSPALAAFEPRAHEAKADAPPAEGGMGTLDLAPGRHVLRLRAEVVPEGELMRPLELVLAPAGG